MYLFLCPFTRAHCLKVKDLELKKIHSHEEIPKVIHGTYHKFWPSIQKQGLKKMKRNHIHFTIGEYGAQEVISGMTCIPQLQRIPKPSHHNNHMFPPIKHTHLGIE